MLTLGLFVDPLSNIHRVDQAAAALKTVEQDVRSAEEEIRSAEASVNTSVARLNQSAVDLEDTS
ncbi:MAG: hypothetical protein ACFB14_08930 [Leptolyngbyaceae cyanobacterium]